MRCIMCGVSAVEDGWKVCPTCARRFFDENEKILAAMFKKVPVEHRGIKYGCVSAFIIRVRSSCTRPLKVPRLFQAELMSGSRGSVTIADPKEVKVLNEYKKGDFDE